MAGTPFSALGDVKSEVGSGNAEFNEVGSRNAEVGKKEVEKVGKR